MKKLAIGMPGFAGLLFLAVLLLSAGACSNQDPQQLIQEANQLLQNRDLIGAEAKFAQYLEQQPHGPSAPMAVWGLAQCSLGQEEYARAREQLQRFIDMIGGPDQLMYTSDYPHWDYDPPSVIQKQSFLSDDEKAQILGGNAVEVFGL